MAYRRRSCRHLCHRCSYCLITGLIGHSLVGACVPIVIPMRTVPRWHGRIDTLKLPHPFLFQTERGRIRQIALKLIVRLFHLLA